jgi:hypothetical protein
LRQEYGFYVWIKLIVKIAQFNSPQVLCLSMKVMTMYANMIFIVQSQFTAITLFRVVGSISAT